MTGVGNIRSPILNSGKFNSSAPLQILPPLKKNPIEWEVSREKNVNMEFPLWPQFKRMKARIQAKWAFK
jgi:hypothetical protein